MSAKDRPEFVGAGSIGSLCEDGVFSAPLSEDMLERAFEMQEQLQIVIYGESVVLVEGSRRRAETMLVALLTELMVEAAEAIRTLRYRPIWDRHQTDWEAAKGEVAQSTDRLR